ncbi:MAG: hypothetical protein Tsb009_01970 [Planctomycetaceae bacterium]
MSINRVLRFVDREEYLERVRSERMARRVCDAVNELCGVCGDDFSQPEFLDAHWKGRGQGGIIEIWFASSRGACDYAELERLPEIAIAYLRKTAQAAHEMADKIERHTDGFNNLKEGGRA